MMSEPFAIVPAVDVLEGRAVRLERGDYERVAAEAGDPFDLIARLAAARPPLLHVVALGAARDGGAPTALARRAVAAAAPVPVQLGGGVRSVADALALAAAGVARVLVGTAAFGSIPLADFTTALGDRLVVAVDVADGFVRTAGWLDSSELTTAEALDRCTAAGVRRILCTAIDRDGTLSGPDLELLREVRSRFDGSILAAGGIRRADDVEATRGAGADGVVVGRALLEGGLDLERFAR
jgi:phosphoribosylformimino-5-aminoimidazole carboxamide ribotide isomerase